VRLLEVADAHSPRSSALKTLPAYNGLRIESHFAGHRRGVVTVEARMTDMTSQAVDRPATSSDGGSSRVWAWEYPRLTSGT